VLVGVPGVTWSDVDRETTPALWSLLEDGAVGTLAARSVGPSACPADGWLAVSAGRRAADSAPSSSSRRCRDLGDPVGGQVPRWTVYLDQARASSYVAHPGTLGELLGEQQVPHSAIGPGAAIALSDRSGRLSGTYDPLPASNSRLTDVVRTAITDSHLVVVDAGALVDPLPGVPDRQRQTELLDRRVAAILEAAGDSATVLIAGLADSGASPRMDLLAVRGQLNGLPAAGLLTSAATRQPGIAQALDIAPTLVELLGLPIPAELVGSPLRSGVSGQSPSDLLNELTDIETASGAARAIVGHFFDGLVAVHLLYLALVVLVARPPRWLRLSRGRDGPGPARPWPRWLAAVSIALALVPAASFLAHLLPWWRSGGIGLYASTMVVVIVVLTSTILAGPWRRDPLLPMAAVGALTSAVLGIDVLTGSHLTIAAPMGLQPLVAGRFYGFGNVQFALFATGCMLVALALAGAGLRAGRRRLALATVVVIGVFAVVVDATPGWGSDFGGPPALVPMFALFALIVAGVRLRPGRVASVFAGAAIVMLLMAVADWLRPPADRTHLGRFVASVLDGDIGPTLARKLSQNAAILVGSPLTLLAFGGIAFVVVVLFRPRRWGGPATGTVLTTAPALSSGVACLFGGLAIGSAVNDSGIAVLAMGVALAVPLLVAARCAGRDAPEEAEPPGSTRSRSRAPQPMQSDIQQPTGGQGTGDVAVLRGSVQRPGHVWPTDPVEKLTGDLADPHSPP